MWNDDADTATTTEPGVRHQATAWTHAIDRLEQYVATHGHARVPSWYRSPDRFRLGAWLSIRRTEHRRGLLACDLAARLEELGVDWEPRASACDEVSLLAEGP